MHGKKIGNQHIQGTSGLVQYLHQRVTGMRLLEKNDEYVQLAYQNRVFDLFVIEGDRVTKLLFQTCHRSPSSADFQILVLLQNIGVPDRAHFAGKGCFDTDCYFVTGVAQSPDRLSTMLLTLASFAPVPEHKHGEGLAHLSVRRIVEDMFQDLSESERAILSALGKTKASMTNLFELLKWFRAQGPGDRSVFEDKLKAMRQKLHITWDRMTDDGLSTLSLKDTCATALLLFPDNCKGFKNTNTLSSTLAYYHTTFTKEKNQYLKKASSQTPNPKKQIKKKLG